MKKVGSEIGEKSKEGKKRKKGRVARSASDNVSILSEHGIRCEYHMTSQIQERIWTRPTCSKRGLFPFRCAEVRYFVMQVIEKVAVPFCL